MKRKVFIDLSEYFDNIDEVLSGLTENDEPVLSWESKIEPRVISTFESKLARTSARLEATGSVMLTHAFMIVNPLPGNEDSVENNLTDLWNNWLIKFYVTYVKINSRGTQLGSILNDYSDLAKKVNDQLPKHGYNRKIQVTGEYIKSIILWLDNVLFKLLMKYGKNKPDNKVIYNIIKSNLSNIDKMEVY